MSTECSEAGLPYVTICIEHYFGIIIILLLFWPKIQFNFFAEGGRIIIYIMGAVCIIILVCLLAMLVVLTYWKAVLE